MFSWYNSMVSESKALYLLYFSPMDSMEFYSFDEMISEICCHLRDIIDLNDWDDDNDEMKEYTLFDVYLLDENKKKHLVLSTHKGKDVVFKFHSYRIKALIANEIIDITFRSIKNIIHFIIQNELEYDEYRIIQLQKRGYVPIAGGLEFK